MACVGMAVPMARSEFSLIPVLESTGNVAIQNIRRENSNEKIKLIIKGMELGILIIAIILFYTGSQELTNQPTDGFICISFGICLMYPCFIICGAAKSNSKALIIFNYLISFLLVIISVVSILSWINLQVVMEENSNLPLKLYKKTQYALNFKLMSGIVCILDGIMYFGESVFNTLQYWNSNVI